MFIASSRYFDVLGRALRVVDRAVVVGVGGADVGEVAPRHHEDRTPVLRHRHDRGDVVAHLLPRHRDVDALGRTDRVRVGALVDRADVVGPHAGRVHDAPGADRRTRGRRPSTVAPSTWPAASLREPGDAAWFATTAPCVGGGAREREREPGVVGLRVVVEVRRRRRSARAASACARALRPCRCAGAACRCAAPPVRSYIHIALPERPGDLRVDEAVLATGPG